MTRNAQDKQEMQRRQRDKPQGGDPGKRGQDPRKDQGGQRNVRPGGHEPGTQRGPKPKRPAAATAGGGKS